MLHKEILTPEQEGMLHLFSVFVKDFGLVGGTAIALHIGHRRSIDFDFFSFEPFDNVSIKQKVFRKKKIDEIFVNRKGELTFSIQGVKITFFHYPFKIDYKESLDHFIHIPDLLTLAAMKAYALGMRAKWKDYVDLYFIMRKYHSIEEIIKRAQSIFGKEFNEKIFRTQLSYFKDINYSEEVFYMPGFEVQDRVVEKGLREFSLQ